MGNASEPEPAAAQSTNVAQENTAESSPQSTSEQASESAPESATAPTQASAPAPAQASETAEGQSPTQTREGDSNIVRGVVAKGDTFEKLFADVDDDQADRYMQAVRSVMRLRSLRAGQPYSLVKGEGNTITRFEYEMDATSRLVVENTDAVATPVARVEAIPYDVKLVNVGATIDDNLFKSVDDLGENPQMAIELARLFGAEINFIRDLQEGDCFTVLVEKRFREGSFRGYGRFLAATFTNKGKTFEAFLFRNGKERPQHYNRKGENRRKTLLQAPLAFTRVSSRFSHSRRHPILGHSRPHLGVDYAAPSGTPVRAVGDGRVTFVGWSGGYGKQIIVRHGAGLESMYSHLSGYARGVRTGQFVKQGQNIGFVGSTGLSTGPHLDFRLKQGGNFINPAKSINPRGEPVSAANRGSFAKTVDMCLEFMQGKRDLAAYTPDTIVPLPAPDIERDAKAPAPAKRSVREGKRSRGEVGRNARRAAKKSRKPRKK